MKRPLLLLAVGAAVASAAWAVLGHFAEQHPRCAGLKQQAAISLRAAEICTKDLIGCRIEYADARAILAEQEAAKACR